MSECVKHATYYIRFKVLGVEGVDDVYYQPMSSLEDMLYQAAYKYSCGNESCDCAKLNFARPYDGDDPEHRYPCGDNIKYDYIYFVTPDKEYDLTKHPRWED